MFAIYRVIQGLIISFFSLAFSPGSVRSAVNPIVRTTHMCKKRKEDSLRSLIGMSVQLL